MFEIKIPKYMVRVYLRTARVWLVTDRLDNGTLQLATFSFNLDIFMAIQRDV